MTIQGLYFNLYDKNIPRNPRIFIETFEKNFLLINNADLNKLDEYEYVMWLTSDYAIQLEELGYLKKSLEYFEKALKLTENYPNYEKEKLFEVRYYELLKFHKARALHNLKKYDASLLIFKELDRVFPKNDQYLSWLNGIRYKLIDRLTWIATYIMFAMLILMTFSRGRNITFDKITYWSLAASFIFFIICLVLNVTRRIKLKKIIPHNKL